MGRKSIVFLRGSVADGVARLTCYKTENQPEEAFKTFTVYRLETPDFTFNTDYKDFFDGLDYREGKVIHQGLLPCEHNLKFTFQDSDLAVGSTYAYWIAPADGVPIGPIPLKVRDPDVWWSYDRIKQRMMKMKTDFTDVVEINTIGRTIKGQPIQAIRVGGGEKCIALIGAVHAGESGPELMIPVMERLLSEEKVLLDQVAIIAIPTLNIDERERMVHGVPWYLRTNANGVDLNRNFPASWEIQEFTYGLDTADPEAMTYRGPGPGSEPETQAAMNWLRERFPLALFNFHCLAGICGWNFLGSRFGGKDEEYIRRCEAFVSEYVRGMSGGDYSPEFLSFECSAGSLATWAYQKMGLPALDIEISQHEKSALQKCQTDRTDKALLEEYQLRHFNGLRNVLKFASRMGDS